MSALQSRKQLLIAEARLQRHLLHVDTARLLVAATAAKHQLVSVRTGLLAGMGLVRLGGLVRGGSPAKSRAGKFLDILRMCGALWTTWRTAVPKEGRAPRPFSDSRSDLIEAMEALRAAARSRDRSTVGHR
jgi:hypothetical protein